jgi:hypothetical protein
VNLFRRGPASHEYPTSDSGTGSFGQYNYDLRPKNNRVTMQLAGSDQFQDEIARVLQQGATEFDVFFAKRTVEEERTDASLPARVFTSGRMSGTVGYVPRGLEPLVFEALSRIERAGRPARIPSHILKTRDGLRVTLLTGKTR